MSDIGLFLLALSLVLALPAQAAADNGAPTSLTRPNIVLIISDDHDPAHYGFRGHPLVQTPHLDRLADQGTRFATAYSLSARCRPTLAGLLSGRYPHQTKVYANLGVEPLSPDPARLPTLLQQAGYQTFLGGKFWEDPPGPAALGFTDKSPLDRDFVRRGQSYLQTFVQQHAGRSPLFVWWAPRLPHRPHTPPDRYRSLYPPSQVPVPTHIPDDRRQRYQMLESTLLSMVTWLDDGIGDLVTLFRQAGVLDNTLFIYLADNGWSNGYLSKGSPYEKGLTTPLIFSWPGRVPAPRTITTPVSLLDVYPTVLDFADIPIPDQAVGRSLKPYLVKEATLPSRPVIGAVYPTHTGDNPVQQPASDVYAFFLREGPLKYIFYVQELHPEAYPDRAIQHILLPAPHRAPGTEELYNLSRDPLETRNLAYDPRYRAHRERFRAQIEAWWRHTGGKPLSLTPKPMPALRHAPTPMPAQ